MQIEALANLNLSSQSQHSDASLEVRGLKRVTIERYEVLLEHG